MVEYEILDPLPRWAYTGSEWSKMIEKADVMKDGYMYSILEPVVADATDIFLNSLSDNKDAKTGEK